MKTDMIWILLRPRRAKYTFIQLEEDEDGPVKT
jgi:hypothetical protein